MASQAYFRQAMAQTIVIIIVQNGSQASRNGSYSERRQFLMQIASER